MRTRFLDIPIDTLTMAETIERSAHAMRVRKRTQHVAINVAKIVKARSDKVLRDDLIGSDIVSIDGMGILLGLRLAGAKVRERVAGIDLMENILTVCALEGFRPFFLGATAAVVQKAADNVRRRLPNLQFAGVRDGYFTAEDEPSVVKSYLESGADCLFIGIPTPHKERFLSKYREELNVPFIMGVGGAFDVIAGKVTRAPKWMQMAGLEWLHRIYQEPRPHVVALPKYKHNLFRPFARAYFFSVSVAERRRSKACHRVFLSYSALVLKPSSCSQ